jgi:DNA-binding winged helix-turn-helix (wHTH) protein
MRFAFGDFVLDDETREMRQAGRAVDLPPKAFQLLRLLLQARPKALSRNRLVATLWSDSHVGQTSLHVLVSELRTKLGDDAGDPRWVRTVHGFGYAFVGTTSSGAEKPGEAVPTRSTGRLRLVTDRQQFHLLEGASDLGRQQGLAIRLDAFGVSRRHARIVVRDGCATLEDLGSKNGTFVRGEPVFLPRVLLDGDEVRLGAQVKLVFRLDPDEPTDDEGVVKEP